MKAEDTTTIEVLICTFQRPQIRQAVDSVLAVAVPNGVTLKIIVVDNDDWPSGRPYLEDLLEDPDGVLTYAHVPGRDISIARNGALDLASGDWVAFLDDDEVAKENWLTQLWGRQAETEADAVFGVVKSVFQSDTPEWMVELGLHAPAPQRAGGEVKTGSCGNALLRWRGTPWMGQRFDLARGRSGGEDTEFFYRVGRMGARFEIASDAIALEPVPKSRQNFFWLAQRRFRSGQTHSVSAIGGFARFRLATIAIAKSFASVLTVIAVFWHPAKWRFWLLRAVFHAGVVAGCLNINQPELYG